MVGMYAGILSILSILSSGAVVGAVTGLGRGFATYLNDGLAAAVGGAGCVNGCPGTWRGTRYLDMPRHHAAATGPHHSPFAGKGQHLLNFLHPGSYRSCFLAV